MQKRILRVFYFHIISLIFTLFKLWCPAHLFPNTPRTLRVPSPHSPHIQQPAGVTPLWAILYQKWEAKMWPFLYAAWIFLAIILLLHVFICNYITLWYCQVCWLQNPPWPEGGALPGDDFTLWQGTRHFELLYLTTYIPCTHVRFFNTTEGLLFICAMWKYPLAERSFRFDAAPEKPLWSLQSKLKK